MTIGLFGGTFDPPHIAHTSLAETFRRQLLLDEVWLLVTPQNPWKRDQRLTSDDRRMAMTRLAVDGHEGLVASDYEFHLPKPTYTFQTLRHLRDDFPQHDFTLLVGGDNWEAFDHWAEYREILSCHDIAVYPRPGCKVTTPDAVSTFLASPASESHGRITILKAEQYPVSSTMIREKVASHEDISLYTAPRVREYILKNGIYL